MANCFFGRIGAALIFLMIAGCADRPTTSVTTRARDVWTFAQGVMIAGPLLVEIDVPSSPEQTDDLAQVVIANMKEAITWSADPRLTADPGEAASQTMKVVWRFSGLGSMDGAPERQRSGADAQSTKDRRVAVSATLVSQGDALSNVHGYVGRADSLADPRFAALIRQVTRELFRYGEEKRDGRILGIGIEGGSATGVAISF
jgi:hypothetical protein